MYQEGGHTAEHRSGPQGGIVMAGVIVQGLFAHGFEIQRICLYQDLALKNRCEKCDAESQEDQDGDTPFNSGLAKIRTGHSSCLNRLSYTLTCNERFAQAT